jgi:succinate-acetate transporter protein
MSTSSVSKAKRAKFSFLAGAMFFLAGTVDCVAGMHYARTETFSVGVLFLALGALWLALGERARREARVLESSEQQIGGV